MARELRGGAAAGTAEGADNRPHIPGLYRQVLLVVCLREVERSHSYALADDDVPAELTARNDAEAALLADRRLVAGTPIEVWHYDLKDLPAPFDQLPAPLDTLGRDPSPRRMTLTPDDRVDATAWFDQQRAIYERARFSRTCDHGYFQSAFILASEFGA